MAQTLKTLEDRIIEASDNKCNSDFNSASEAEKEATVKAKKPPAFKTLDCDDLKPYCRVEGPSSSVGPNGYSSCEGSYCVEAYKKYCEKWEPDE